VNESSIKQRIIGAIVLVSLAVIFIPMILSGSGEQNMPLFGSPIPPKPENITNIKVLEFDNVPTPPAPRSVIRTPVDQHSKTDDIPIEAPVKPKEVLTTKPASIVKEAKSLKAWVVQVGSFSQRSNALKLKDKMLKKGFRAFVERITTHDKASYRVRVGPELRRDDALKVQQQIEQKMKIKGLVVAHP